MDLVSTPNVESERWERFTCVVEGVKKFLEDLSLSNLLNECAIEGYFKPTVITDWKDRMVEARKDIFQGWEFVPPEPSRHGLDLEQEYVELVLTYARAIRAPTARCDDERVVRAEVDRVVKGRDRATEAAATDPASCSVEFRELKARFLEGVEIRRLHIDLRKQWKTGELHLEKSTDKFVTGAQIKIGRGSYGNVYVHSEGDAYFAVKVLKNANNRDGQIEEKDIESMYREANIIRFCAHKNLVNVLSVGVHRGTEGLQAYIKMELACYGSLWDVYKKGPFPSSLTLSWIVDGMAGLAHMHRCGVKHRDIKSLNMLVFDGLVVKLTDFGEAKPDSTIMSNIDTDNQQRGTTCWMDYELRYGRITSEAKSDVFAMAVTTKEVFMGEDPKTPEDTVQISSVKIFFQRNDKNNTNEATESFAEVLKNMGTKLRKDRLNSNEALAALKGVLSLLGGDPRDGTLPHKDREVVQELMKKEDLLSKIVTEKKANLPSFLQEHAKPEVDPVQLEANAVQPEVNSVQSNINWGQGSNYVTSSNANLRSEHVGADKIVPINYGSDQSSAPPTDFEISTDLSSAAGNSANSAKQQSVLAMRGRKSPSGVSSNPSTASGASGLRTVVVDFKGPLKSPMEAAYAPESTAVVSLNLPSDPKQRELAVLRLLCKAMGGANATWNWSEVLAVVDKDGVDATMLSKFGGVDCMDVSGEPLVVHLNLSGNNLKCDSLPPEVFALQHMKELHLFRNSIAGMLPRSVGLLADSLTVLNLGHNQFSGGIPWELFNCHQLTVLDLSFNDFSGFIPPPISRLKQLEFLYLQGNRKLGGLLPDNLGELKQLSLCDLSYCSFDEPIPKALGGCTRLRELLLCDNKFTGALPTELSRCTDLITLNVAENAGLQGGVPECYTSLTKLLFGYFFDGCDVASLDTLKTALPNASLQ